MVELRRALGRWDLTAIGVNQVIGAAIFILPADVARLVGPWGPAAFLAVGLLSTCIALCFAEVGSRFDRTGGPYLPARAAFGRFIGFEVGWIVAQADDLPTWNPGDEFEAARKKTLQ